MHRISKFLRRFRVEHRASVRIAQVAGLAIVLAVVGSVLFSGSLRVGATATVTGFVKNPSNVAVSGVNVNFWGPSGGSGATSQPDGSFSVMLNPGHYQSQAVPTSGPYAPSTIFEFDVVDGSAAPVHTYNLTVIQMQGRFTKSDGTGVRGSINVFNGDFSQNIHVESNDAGYYVLGGLPAGSYTAQPMVGWSVTGLTAPDPEPITLTTSSVLIKDYTLGAAAKTITGTVTRTGGAAVTNVCVNANKMNGQGWANANTDGAGNYSIAVSGGSWNIQPNPCGSDADWIYGGPPVMVDFALDATVESKAANFVVATAAVTVSGTISDQNGAALSSGGVDFRTQAGTGSHANVNSNGTYTARMTAGTYNIFFWTQNNAYSLPQTSITVADGESRTLNLSVVAKTAHITGTVKDASGAAAPNVNVNANEMSGPGGKPGSWGNARSNASGGFDLLVTPGTYNVNIGTEPGSSYVWANPSQIQIAVPSSTSVITPADYPVLNFVVAKADAKIVGKLTAGGSPINNAPLCVYARPVGVFDQPCSPLQPNGSFTINVSSAAGTAFEIGCFSPPNMPFSCPQAMAVTVVPNGTVTKDLDLTMNNSAIVGQLYDQSGFPLSNCANFRGGRVFADNPGGNGAHYEGEIGTDCKFRISLVAGVYFMNSFFPPDSGAMNAPPGSPVQVFNGQTVQKNIMVAKADASITVTLLDKNGNGTQGYINVDNNEEINMSREGNKGPGGPGPGQGQGADLGFGKNMPCNSKDIKGVMNCCKDTKNKTQCIAFKIPDGPQGCKNAFECVQLCVKDPKICSDANNGNQTSGPQPGTGAFTTGPGGCKSETECKTYCSAPEHQDECSKFAPPPGVQAQSVGRPTRVIGTVSALAETDDKGPGFDKGIHSSGPTDFQGNAKIQVLSGHRYKVCAGLPPESNDMPPKCQTADLTTVKSATVVLRLRDADAQLTGTVKMPNGTLATRCFVHAWAEDGSFSGQPCSGNGTYKLNLTADTTWHYGADSMDGSKFYRSEEQRLTVEKGKKSYTQNLELKEGAFEVPQPVTVSGDCSSPLVISMSNKAKISIPAAGISTSTTGQCSCTATPTIDLIATQSNQPQGAGYTIDCRDETGAQVTQLQSNATVTVPYSLSSDEEGTSIEDALKPVLYQSDTQSYKTVDSYTLDKQNNLITFSVSHFSAYTVSNSSGISSKDAALKTVTTSKTKAGVTSFKVNSKKVTPFPKCKGTVNVTTKGVNGVQYVAAASSCEGNLRVYDTNGRSKKVVGTGWRGVNAISFADVTKDGVADILAAPVSGRQVVVVNVAKKYQVMKVDAGKRTGKYTVAGVDFTGNGADNLVAALVSGNTAGNFQAFQFVKGKFSPLSSSYAVYLKNSGGAIGYAIAAPTISGVKGSASVTAANAKITVLGKDFTPDSTVLIGSVGATKVSRKSATELSVTFNATKLTAGKYVIRVSNPGGKVSGTKVKVTVK